MNASEVMKALTKLRAFYPNNQVPDGTLALYAAELVDQDARDLSAGLTAATRTLKWFPALSEIIEACGAARKDRELRERKILFVGETIADLRRQLADGCPRVSMSIGAKDAAKVTSSRTWTLFDKPMTVEFGLSVGGRMLPKLVDDAGEADWIRGAELQWKLDTEKKLKDAEAELAYLGGSAIVRS